MTQGWGDTYACTYTHTRVHTHTQRLWNLHSSNTDTYQPFSAWTLTQNDKGGSPKVTCSHHHSIMPLESHQLLQVFLFGELRSRAYECRKPPLSSPDKLLLLAASLGDRWKNSAAAHKLQSF